MRTVIVWFRSDLRIHDHPALVAASEADVVVPVFIFNNTLLHGKHASSNRNRFLLQSLQDLKLSLQNLGADLVVRSGDATEELKRLAHEVGAQDVFYTSDYSPYSVRRDARVEKALHAQNIEARGYAGKLIVSNVNLLKTKAGTTHKIFTPFSRNWLSIVRREIAPVPTRLSFPPTVTIGELPALSELTDGTELSPDVIPGGEREGRDKLKEFLDGPIHRYHERNNELASDATSRLSAYFHLGCLSPLEVEDMLPNTDGANAWRRQLCWRDFYYYVLFHYPDNAVTSFQEKYRTLKWNSDPVILQAWKDGVTGYPVVDACMRQLKAEGWMHNRGRLIVGSFLTKDLWLDWRLGETYFMNMLIDGDEANNNGNWQWIASVGVDPAPVFRRLYNPTSQGKNYDPQGDYIRRYVPELAQVPTKYIFEPWTMPGDEQEKANCIIGEDYPEPMVDHKTAREFALEQYRHASQEGAS